MNPSPKAAKIATILQEVLAGQALGLASILALADLPKLPGADRDWILAEVLRHLATDPQRMESFRTAARQSGFLDALTRGG